MDQQSAVDNQTIANSFLVETTGLSRVYRRGKDQIRALDGINLRIKQGTFTMLVGPSGGGKSTLLHILGGLDSPTSGEVRLNGERIDNMREAQRAILRRKQIGFVFQAFNLISNLSVGDNVELPALVAGVGASLARQRREGLLRELGLGDKSPQVPNQLSGGEKQRVALARALVNHPTILLADEPTGNLDSKITIDVLRLLRQTHEQGQAILMVTHDPNVASIAQRVVFMRDGQITHETVLERQHDVKTVIAGLLDMEG